MLVDVMTAITGPFGFCTGKPMKVEQMTAIIGRIRFSQWQAKSGLTIIEDGQTGPWLKACNHYTTGPPLILSAANCYV